MPENNSNLRFISLGIVLADKNDNSPFALVMPKEHLPFHEGDVTADITTINRTGIDIDGNAYSINLQKGLGVKAKWYGNGNRRTAPNVVKGEEVELYEINNTGIYLWKEIGNDNHLRRQEAVTWAFRASSAPVDTDIPPTADDCYTATVDGKNGHITIATSTNNQERAKYTAQLNGRDGHLTLSDNKGNLIQIDSETGTIVALNNSGSHVSIQGTEITAQAKDTITIISTNVNIIANTTTISGDVIIQKSLTVDGESNLKGNISGNNANITNVTTQNLSAANNPI